jgi:hypothetical protein
MHIFNFILHEKYQSCAVFFLQGGDACKDTRRWRGGAVFGNMVFHHCNLNPRQCIVPAGEEGCPSQEEGCCRVIAAAATAKG